LRYGREEGNIHQSVLGGKVIDGDFGAAGFSGIA